MKERKTNVTDGHTTDLIIVPLLIFKYRTPKRNLIRRTEIWFPLFFETVGYNETCN